MQRQEQQLQQQMAGTGVTVERDPVTNNIDLVMPGNITFAATTPSNSSFNNTLILAATTSYNQTTVNIMGLPTALVRIQQDLSQRRAASVNYLVNQGVSANRGAAAMVRRNNR